MNAYRLTLAVLLLILYSSCTQDDLLSERSINDEFNNEIALVEDSRATPIATDLADFFKDYDFQNENESLLEKGGKILTYPSKINRDDKLVVIYENHQTTPSAVLEQKGTDLSIFNDQLAHQFAFDTNAESSRNIINCILALAEYSQCLVDMYNTAVANPGTQMGQDLINNPILFWTVAAIACELKIMDVLTALNQLGCLLFIAL